MGKITFRADDDLVADLEAFDTSKSEVMRQALREYLVTHQPSDTGSGRESTGATESANAHGHATDSLDAFLEERIDAMLADRLGMESGPRGAQDVNVTISLEGVRHTDGVETRVGDVQPPASSRTAAVERDDHQEFAGEDRARQSTAERPPASRGESGRKTHPDRAGTSHARPADGRHCSGCGTALGDDHVFCPNCGEKNAHRVFCDCGDEVRSDWAFCPSCGRRTPAADVLDSNGTIE